MSAARSDLVNAVELAGRSATLERELERTKLPRLAEAGALDGTVVHARLTFGLFEARPTVEVSVAGRVMLPCQRCLRPCACEVDDTSQVVVVADDAEEAPGGFDPVVGDAEHLSVTELIEEQILLGMPLVPMHEDAAECGESAADEHIVAAGAPAEEKQRPFANLRELLDKGER
ncbi:MAG: hypothetical protein FIB04_03745 [Gammaproteobacteria bacterium]|nr:hypothetical protein [Gammaproteobacteria bacterium]